MATSPTSQSAMLSGAAKDDVVGLNGDVTFTIADLLANDPGGAAKISTVTQFFFGSSINMDAQKAYLTAHGITWNENFTEFTLHADSTDFQYMVQIGNKGTWSQGDVDVIAPQPHAGDNLFTENFDGYQGQYYQDGDGNQQFGIVDLNQSSGWTGASHTELGANGYGTIPSTSGGYWLDTMNSPGGIDISHVFTDTTAAVGGKTATLSFDITTQSLTYNGTPYATDPNASFEFRIDGVKVAEFHAADFVPDVMQHKEVAIASYFAAGPTHTLELVDTSSATNSYTGFSIDTVKIDDWVA